MLHETSTKGFTPYSVRLKNSIEVTIREATIQDAPDLIRCIKTYIADSQYQVMEPDEFAPDIAQGREFISNLLQSENSLLLVATANDTIIGNFDITGGRRRRLTHTGLVGLGMLKEYQSQGLGAEFLKIGIAWARTNPFLKKLWLQIIADNTAAVKLYQKMGFAEDGRQENFIREGKDVYRDNLIMSMML